MIIVDILILALTTYGLVRVAYWFGVKYGFIPKAKDEK